MDKQTVVDTHNEISFGLKREDILIHATTRMNLEVIMQSEVKVLVTQSHPTVCDSVDSSPPGSSVHRISQARKPEGIVIPFSRGSSQPRDQTQVSYIAGRFFMVCATREAPSEVSQSPKDKEHVTPHVWGPLSSQIHRDRKWMGGEGHRKLFFNAQRASI